MLSVRCWECGKPFTNELQKAYKAIRRPTWKEIQHEVHGGEWALESQDDRERDALRQKLAEGHADQYRLTKHHLQGFDYYCMYLFDKIIIRKTVIHQVFGDRFYRITFRRPRFGTPSLKSTGEPLIPAECAKTNQTYAMPIYVEVVFEVLLHVRSLSQVAPFVPFVPPTHDPMIVAPFAPTSLSNWKTEWMGVVEPCFHLFDLPLLRGSVLDRALFHPYSSLLDSAYELGGSFLVSSVTATEKNIPTLQVPRINMSFLKPLLPATSAGKGAGSKAARAAVIAANTAAHVAASSTSTANSSSSGDTKLVAPPPPPPVLSHSSNGSIGASLSRPIHPILHRDTSSNTELEPLTHVTPDGKPGYSVFQQRRNHSIFVTVMGRHESKFDTSTKTVYLRYNPQKSLTTAYRLVLKLPFIPYEPGLSLSVFLFALGVSGWDEITDMLKSHAKETWQDEIHGFLLGLWKSDRHHPKEVVDRESALRYISKYTLKPCPTVEMKMEEVRRMLNADVLPGYGLTNDAAPSKRFALVGDMNLVILWLMGYVTLDERETQMNLRYETVQTLEASLIRQTFSFWTKHCARCLLHRVKLAIGYATPTIPRSSLSGTTLFVPLGMDASLLHMAIDWKTVIRQGWPSRSTWWAHSNALGKWAPGRKFARNAREGITTKTERSGPFHYGASVRRNNNPTLKQKAKTVGGRLLHGTRFGRTDPSATPEGPLVGAVSFLSNSTEITPGSSSFLLLETLFQEGVRWLPFTSWRSAGDRPVIRINSVAFGFVPLTTTPEEWILKIRSLRRQGVIDYTTSVAWRQHPQRNEINVSVEQGRMVRPLIILDAFLKLFQDLKINRLPEVELDASPDDKEHAFCQDFEWNQFREAGIVEFLDRDEEQNLSVAMSLDDWKKRSAKGVNFTHMEIDGALILGICSARAVMANHNQSPRNILHATMMKQAICGPDPNGIYTFGSTASELYSSQIPLVVSKTTSSFWPHHEPGVGRNMRIALLNTRSNCDDGQQVASDPVEWGALDSAHFRTYSATQTRKGQVTVVETLKKPVWPCVAMKDMNYDHLDPKVAGLPPLRTKMDPTCIVLGKTTQSAGLSRGAHVRLNSQHLADEHLRKKERCESVTMRIGEFGMVEKVERIRKDAERITHKVRIRGRQRLQNGDKTSSQHGQKGVASCLVSAADNYTDMITGERPFMCLNNACIITRMTIGQIWEMLVSAMCAFCGIRYDGSPFIKHDLQTIEQVMKWFGMSPSGESTYVNGRNGELLDCTVFSGFPTQYKLSHMVESKIQARFMGPIQYETRLPTESRSRHGGGRVGEMERDCFIGHGAMDTLEDAFFWRADKFMICVCPKCECYAEGNLKLKKGWCRYCQSEDVRFIPQPYNAKRIFQMIGPYCVVFCFCVTQFVLFFTRGEWNSCPIRFRAFQRSICSV